MLHIMFVHMTYVICGLLIFHVHYTLFESKLLDHVNKLEWSTWTEFLKQENVVAGGEYLES